MSLKKIFAVCMACLMAIGAFTASAVTLDVAEVAGESIENEAVLAESPADYVSTGGTVTVNGGTDTYASLTEASEAAVADANGVVTYTINGKVEYVTGTDLAKGAKKVVIGGDGELTLTTKYHLGITATGADELVIENIQLNDKSDLSNAENALTAWEWAYITFDGTEKITLNNVTFTEGVQFWGTEAATLTGCTFNVNIPSIYSVWVGTSGTVVIDGCKFNGTRGVKTKGAYATADIVVDVTVKECTFNLTEKPALVHSNTKGGIVTLEDNTYTNAAKGVYASEADGTITGSDLEAVRASVTKNGETTYYLTTADAAADGGAENVDVIVAMIGTTAYTTIDAAVAAATGDDVITLLADTSTDTKLHFVDHVTLDLNGNTLTTSKTMYADGGALINIISSVAEKGVISYTEPYEAIYVRGAINKLENIKIDGNNTAKYGVYVYAYGRYINEITNCEIVNVKNGIGTYKVNNTRDYPALGRVANTQIDASDIGIFFFRGGMANIENSVITGGRLGIAYWGHSADAGYVNVVNAKDSTITGTTGTAVEMLTEWHNTNNLVYEMNLDNCELIGAKGAATIDYTAVADSNKAFVTADSDIVCYVDNEGILTYYTVVPEEYEGTLYEVVATVNDVDYYSFEAALVAANAYTEPVIIDLLGNTVSASEVTGIHLKNTITIENGTIDVTDVVENGDAIISIGDRTATPDLTLNNVNVTGKNYSEAFGIFYIIPAKGNAGTLTLNNCNFNLENNETESGGVIKSDGAIANVVISNCEFNLINPTRIFNNVTVDIDNTTIVAEINENGIVNNAFRAVAGTITDSNITAIGFENGIKNKENGFNLVLDGTTVVKLIDCDKGVPADNELGYDIYLTANNTITVEDEAKLYADTVYVGEGSAVNADPGAFVSVANTIEVKFEKVDVDAESNDNVEEYDLYNIVLAGANDETINRLNSADLTFKLTSAPVAGGKVDYSIIPVAKVTVTPDTVTPDENRFMFNFKGKDLAVIGGADTAKEIVIGQVKVAGYGKYTFAVNTDATATNIAHATTISDNIVDTFVPNGSIAAGKGTLDLDEATTGEQEIAVPTRKLTINIDFPNSVDNKTMLYQDMTVTVSGGDLADAIVVELGNDADNTTVTFDGAYQVILDKKLTKSIAYNVTVEGAGYRTARYTVTMTEDKTVNFWNNVKDNETAVEEGKAYATSNFLAGDIVGDNEINIYDLSAVVSYFATVIDDEDMYERYVKYDLNRDGVIDSKDVAYVLVSWGN